MLDNLSLFESLYFIFENQVFLSLCGIATKFFKLDSDKHKNGGSNVEKIIYGIEIEW